MPLLDRDFLQTIGITLDEQAYVALADHFKTTLFQRVIAEIVDELTPEQAAELAALEGDDERINQWLVDNVTDLQEIVQDEVDILLGEIAEDSEKFTN